MEGKNCTEFGIGVSIAEVVRAVFHDEDRILPVSVLLEGQYGQHDVYASVPARLNREGALQGVSGDSLALMARALEYRDATGGAFDITIAPVMDAWGFTGDAYRVPT